MPRTITLTAGIDTSKSKLDVGIHGRKRGEIFENAQAGWGRLLAWLTSEGVRRVGIEATGGYERGVTRHLQNAGIEVVVLQSKQVKAFGQLHLRRAKSDRIDAFLIAACTHLLDAQNRIPPDPRFDALADHLTYIEQIEEDVARLKTRLEHIGDRRMRRTINGDIARLTKRRDDELKRLQAALRAYPDLARRFDLVLSIPGIGARTTLSIVVRLPELGQINREQVASLAGLAPFVQQSGKWKGETHICGGRGRLRRAVYAASLAAAFHWNPALKTLYTRLTQRGKSHTSASVACARKPLIFANTVVSRGTPWVDSTAAA
jgi:transposase